MSVQEANAYVACSHYSLDDLRFAWRYWKNEGDVDGFEAFIRRCIAESSNARIRRSIEQGRRMAA